MGKWYNFGGAFLKHFDMSNNDGFTVGDLKKLLEDFDDNDEVNFIYCKDGENLLGIESIEHTGGGFHSECTITFKD